MYSIDGIETMIDLVAYTKSAMIESGFSSDDVNDYLFNAINSNTNYNTVLLSKEYLEQCNSLKSKSEDYNKWFDYTWRDSYCSSLWDDDGERYSKDDDEELEAYEGFNSCSNHYWDSSEDDELDDTFAIKTYYDSMRHEYDSSYDEHIHDDKDYNL